MMPHNLLRSRELSHAGAWARNYLTLCRSEALTENTYMSSVYSLPILATLGLDPEHDLQAVLQAATDHLWMHASPWQALTTCADRRLLVSGHGCTVVDAHGRAYLDALSGLWLVNVGHGRSAIAEAMAQQAKTLAYASASRATTLPAIQLATLLARLTPGDLSVVLFSGGGSEAVESALKIARQYHTLRGEPERYKVIARRGSYHGATYGAMSVSGAPRSVDPYYSPLVPGGLTISAPYCYRCDYRKTYPACEVYCVDAIEDLIVYENPRSVAAVIAEPISAACGVVVPPAEYFPRLRDICDRHGVLLIFDEIITGFNVNPMCIGCPVVNRIIQYLDVAAGVHVNMVVRYASARNTRDIGVLDVVIDPSSCTVSVISKRREVVNFVAIKQEIRSGRIYRIAKVVPTAPWA